jgi:hypothetical protein
MTQRTAVRGVVVGDSVHTASGDAYRLEIEIEAGWQGHAINEAVYVVPEYLWTGWTTGMAPPPIVGSPDLRDMFQQLRNEYGDQRVRAVCVSFINTFDGREDPDIALRKWCVDAAIDNGASGGFTTASDAQTIYDFVTGRNITPEVRDTFLPEDEPVAFDVEPKPSTVRLYNHRGDVCYQHVYDPNNSLRIGNLAGVLMTTVNEIEIIPGGQQ